MIQFINMSKFISGLVLLAAVSFGFQGCQTSNDVDTLTALQNEIQNIGMQCGGGIVVINASLNQPHSQEGEHHQCKHRIGSGFVFRSDGIIVTTDGLLGDAETFQVITQSNHRFDAELVGRDFETNIAVLKIDTTGLTPLTFPDRKTSAGCFGIMIGNTFYSQGLTCGWGLINQTWIGGSDFLDDKLLSMHLNWPDVHSGTPVMDVDGRLIGIAEGCMAEMNSAWTIIPSSTVSRVAEKLLNEGEIQRGWLGIKSDPICPERQILALLNDWKGKGAVVSNIISGSPAERAAIIPGDIIVKLNNSPIKCISDLRRKVTEIRPDTNVIIEIIRKGEDIEVEVNLDPLTNTPDRGRRSLSRSA